MRSAAWLGLAAALALAAPMTAFPLASQPYAATAPFAGGVDGIAGSTILSGALNASLAPAHGPFVALNATGFAVMGLTRVCWTAAGGVLPDCHDSAGGALQLVLSDGASVGMQFPRDAVATVSTRHSIAAFVDVAQDLEFEGYTVRLGRSLAAVHVGGRVSMPALPSMPPTALQDMRAENAAGLVLLGGNVGRLTVRDGSQELHTFTAAHDVVTFQGSPRIAPFAAGATLAPFAPGSTAALAPADADAARQGVDLGRVDRMVGELQQAFGGHKDGSGGVGNAVDPGLQAALGSILGGALLRIPAQPSGKEADVSSFVGNLTLLRFDALTATATPDGAVALSGGGPLEIQSGRVVGAPSLLGVLPWWCWLLWVAAIGLWIARLVVKPAKQNERWDRLRWVGWVASPLASLLVSWLWDGQVHELLGVSLLRGASGSVLALVLVVELVIGLVIYIAAVLPMASLLKSGARFAGQGRFMGLHRPVALLLGFVLGTTLLLSYIDFIISLVR